MRIGSVGSKTMQQSRIHPIEWRDNQLILLDQRLLPNSVEFKTLSTVQEVYAAIANMVVRGAPAIGVTAAYGVVLAARAAYSADSDNWNGPVQAAITELAEARPTAVNLRWALRRMQAAMPSRGGNPVTVLLTAALAIHDQEVAANLAMGVHGAVRIDVGARVITHCNTGALATGGSGTAFSVIRTAHDRGQIERVFACETRPWLQGARLTAWELQQYDIPFELLVDSAAAYLMKVRRIDWVIVGADRIAANGDVANKIGTYALANAARRHKVGFMVVAPVSTIDSETSSGEDIELEMRDSAEVVGVGGTASAPPGSAAWNPVFDVTEAAFIDLLVTEKGVVEAPDREKIAAHLRRPE